MGDVTVVNALRRFFTKDEIEAAYKAAFKAHQERLTEVVVTGANFEGGAGNGQLAGDPRDLMQACELILAELEASENGVDANSLPGTTHIDFSRGKYLET